MGNVAEKMRLTDELLNKVNVSHTDQYMAAFGWEAMPLMFNDIN